MKNYRLRAVEFVKIIYNEWQQHLDTLPALTLHLKVIHRPNV